MYVLHGVKLSSYSLIVGGYNPTTAPTDFMFTINSQLFTVLFDGA